MAMTTCRECEKPVSTEAKTCPHCGTSAPAKKKKKGGLGKLLLMLMAIGLVASFLQKNETSSAQAPASAAKIAITPVLVEKKVAKVLAAECKVAKKDGTLDERECDLEELCKDWVFYRGKTLKHSREGEQSKLSEAQRAFNKTNVWLRAYQEKDVSACLQKHSFA